MACFKQNLAILWVNLKILMIYVAINKFGKQIFMTDRKLDQIQVLNLQGIILFQQRDQCHEVSKLYYN